MMSDEHAKSKKVHGELDSNVIQFPKPSEAGGSGSKEDVGNEPPTYLYFIPEWDTDGDDTAS